MVLIFAADLTGEGPPTWGILRGHDALDECLEGDF